MFPILEAGPSLEGAALPAFVVARDGLYLRKRSLLGLSQTKVGRIAHRDRGLRADVPPAVYVEKLFNRGQPGRGCC